MSEREGTAFDWLQKREARSWENPGGEATSDTLGGASSGAIKEARGRKPGGKRANPDYEQASAYVRKKVYRRVKQALMAREEDNTEYSALVEELLIRWLSEVGWDLEEEGRTEERPSAPDA